MADKSAHLTESTIPKQTIHEQKYDFHTFNPPKCLEQDIVVTFEEIIEAKSSIQAFFHIISFDMDDYAIQLVRLNKLRIHDRLNISEETENMIHNAREGNFTKALSILRSYPFIVNCIPTNSKWGLIHYAAFSNDFDVVKAILDSPKCDPSLCTTEVRDGISQVSCTAYDIAQVERVKALIWERQQRKLKEKGQPPLQMCVSFCYEDDIKVESIILILKCFSNVLYPQTLQSRESLIYSNLMLDTFTFIDTGENWKRARREISFQLQSLDLRDASFLATGQDNGDIMDDISEAKEDFYSRVIQLYNRCNTNYGSKFHSALNRSLSTDNYTASSFSLEDLALLAYGVLLNSILMNWGGLYTTVETTYRGVYLTDKELSLYREGCTFSWFGFNSCCLTRENAHGNVIFVIDNRHISVYGTKLISGTKYVKLSNHYLYPSGIQFRVDRVHKESIGFTIFVHLEDYSRVQQVPPPETDQEFVAAKKSLLIFFENLKYGIRENLVLDLVKLRKFRICSSLDVSKVIDEAIKHAKIGNFKDALAILDEYPYIVNFIPVNRAWGLLHQAAYFNDIDVVKKILKNPKCDPSLRTKMARDGKIEASSTVYDIAKDKNLKALIVEHQKKKSKELRSRPLPKSSK